MKKALLCLFEGVQWLKWGISVDESLLFGVRVRRVFVVLRLLHGGYCPYNHFLLKFDLEPISVFF